MDFLRWMDTPRESKMRARVEQTEGPKRRASATGDGHKARKRGHAREFFELLVGDG